MGPPCTSRDPHRSWLGLGWAWAILALALGSARAAEPGSAQSTHGTLHILWQQELPPYPSGPAMDVRWAEEATILVAWAKEGVSEVALDGKFSPVRWLIPDPEHHFRGFELLAASKEFVAASSAFNAMAYRPRARQSSGLVAITKVSVGIVEALDLSGHQLAVLGNPAKQPSPKGVVAWLGPISEHPERDLLPLPLRDVGAVNPDSWDQRTLANCSTLRLGAVRFLPDGSLMVVPGFQAGAQLFSSGGRPLRSWDTAAFGLDAPADCAAMSPAQKSALGTSIPERFAFLNRHRVLEDILPLQEGPGLLIRWVADGKVHWQLTVLQSGTRVLTYTVPFTGELPYDRLRGDVQGSRVVLLRGAHGFDFTKKQPFASSLVAVAELPSIGRATDTKTGGQR
jgi:hypothetical protein